jgi:hypothetical protein
VTYLYFLLLLDLFVVLLMIIDRSQKRILLNGGWQVRGENTPEMVGFYGVGW